MSFTKSKLGNEGKSSLKFSIDNLNWINVPSGIDVRGSKYAIICSELIDCKRILNLNNYTVAIGASANRPASQYIKNRVDKACLVKTNDEQLNPHEIEILLISEVIEPYAVFMA